MMKTILLIFGLLLSSSLALAGPVGAPDSVYRMGATGLRPNFGQIDLSKSAAVKNLLGVANGGSGAATFTANHPLLGNGAGAFTVGAVTGNTTTFATASGVLISGNCVKIDASGNFVDAGAACGTGGGGFTNPMTTLGDMMFEDVTPTAARLAGNTTTTKKFMTQTGTGTVSAPPAWGVLTASDLPLPTATTVGGIESFAVVTHQFLNSISTSGVPSSAQPAFTDISGTNSVAQVNTVSGTGAAPGSITAAGGITAAAAIPFQTQFIQGSAGAVTITANPQVSAGTVVGQIMYLIGGSDTNTVTFSDGTGVSLNGSATLYNHSALALVWDGTVWTELYRRP